MICIARMPLVPLHCNDLRSPPSSPPSFVCLTCLPSFLSVDLNSSTMMRQRVLRSLKPSGRLLATSPTARRAFTSTPLAPAEVEITIDGKKVTIEAGSALIQACEKAGVTIPRYCYHVTFLDYCFSKKIKQNIGLGG